MDLLPSSEDARFIALTLVLPIALVASVVMTVWVGWRGWATYRKIRVAEMLLQLHLDAAAARANAAARRAAKLGGRVESVSTSVNEMQTSIRELRYLVSLVPRERERVKRQLLDLMLPAMLREKL